MNQAQLAEALGISREVVAERVAQVCGKRPHIRIDVD